MVSDQSVAGTERLRDLTQQLLVKDVERHREALRELAEVGDERVVPHLVEVLTLDAIANDWEQFGFPEIFRDKPKPYPLSHPELSWPGVVDALCAIADPDYDSEVAWLQWETWYTQQEDIEPLEGFLDWKVRFYRSYHPLVGHVLDTEPKRDDFHRIRWGSCDRSTLHPLNFPDFLPEGETDYLEDDDLVYGFEVGGESYAVPRFILFPHEMINAEFGGRPLCLSFCTMCNSPILYDRRANGREFQFGSTGLIWYGNKAMYDEETHSLWNQQTGVPIAGPMLETYREEEFDLEFLPITQTTWDEWVADHPETRVLDPETGYEYDYERYRDYDGFIKKHYWENPDVVHPGVTESDDGLDGQTYVYGVEADDGGHVYPVEAVRDREPLTDVVDGSDVVVVSTAGDVGVYRSPPTPVEREADELVDGEGRRWQIRHDGLHADGETLDRLSGRHGLWLSFRPHYEEHTVVDGA